MGGVREEGEEKANVHVGGITQQCLILCNRKIAKERRPKGGAKAGIARCVPPTLPTLMTSLEGNGELIEF